MQRPLRIAHAGELDAGKGHVAGVAFDVEDHFDQRGPASCCGGRVDVLQDLAQGHVMVIEGIEHIGAHGSRAYP